MEVNPSDSDLLLNVTKGLNVMAWWVFLENVTKACGAL